MYFVIAALVAVLLAGFGGFKLGVDHEVASQAREDKLVQRVIDGHADAVAKLRPKYTTIQNEVQREIDTKIVYRDCRHSTDGLRIINQALTGGEPAGKSELPKVDTPD